MRLPHFVSGSAVILAGWLAVTFVYDVPSQRYPKLNKYPASRKTTEHRAPVTPATTPESAVAQVSVSH